MDLKKNTFSEIVRLALGAGGKCLIVNEEGEVRGVFLTPEEYEKILQGKKSDFSLKKEKKSHFSEAVPDPLTEKEILDRINRELQEWEESQTTEKVREIEAELAKNGVKNEEEDRYYLEPVD